MSNYSYNLAMSYSNKQKSSKEKQQDEEKEQQTVDTTQQKYDMQRKKTELSAEEELARKPGRIQEQKDREEFSDSSQVPSEAQVKADTAKKQLEMYRNSEEKKKNAEKRLQDKYAQQLLYGITDSSEVLYDEDPREKELQAEADYWDNKVKQEADEKLFASNMQEIQNLSGAERTAFENYANNRTFVDPENLEAYKRLKERYGDKLNDLKYTYQRDKEEKAAREMAEKTAAKMDQGGWLADTGRNVLSLGANLVGGITGTAGRINEMVNGTGPYQTVAQYTYGDVPSVYGQTVRNKTSEQILAGQDLNVSDGISGRELGAIAYQGGMGALDTGARLLASGGNPFLAAGMAASQTFSSTVQEAAEKGATPQEAYALATVSAGIEALTEKLPLDNLVSIAKGGANPKMIVNLLLQAGVEIGEEEASLIGTTLAEMAILKEKSDYQQQIRKAVAMGVPYEQAVAEADQALLEEAKQTALVSGFSGLLSAGGAEGRNRLLGGNQSQQQTAQQPAAVQQEQTPVQTEQAAQPAQPVQEAQKPQQKQQPTAAAPEAKPEAPAPQQKAEPDWAEQTFRELDEQRKSDKERQQKAYEAVKAEERKVNQLEKDIAKAEKKLAETGKGSQARIDQMKQELERQKGIVAQKQRFLDYQDSSYDTNLESAIKTQQDLYENARMQVTLAIADYNDGRISEAQLQDAKDTYNNAGQELYRLKNMTPEQYRMELVSMGLLGEMAGKPNTARPVADTKAAPVQTQQETAQQTQTAAETPLQKVTDTVTETITGRPAAASQTSTQQTDTQNRVKPDAMQVQEQSAEGGQAEQTQKQTAPQTGDVKMQRARPDDVRPITVPVTDPQGKRVSEAAGNAQGSELTPDSMAKEIEQLVADGNLGFDVRTNRESLENAAAEIKKKGPANVRNRITRSIESRKIKDGDIEQAILLYQKYANGDKDTDLDNASEMMVDLATMANITGRNLQLFKLLRKMTPEGQLLAVQKEVERNVQSLVNSGKVKKGYEAQIDESLKTEYLNAAKELQKAQKGEDAAKIAEAEQKVKDAQNAIYASEAAKMPATFKAKWDAWRYMAMLGNAKTQVRNVAGNLMFEPYKVVKDKMAALVEKSLPQDQRTKSLVQDPALLQWAKQDAKTEDVTNALKYSAKLGDNTAKDQISEQMKVFDNKALESARKFVAKVPQAGDMLFKNDYYSRSLAGFLKARGYTAAQVQSGQVSDTVLNEARRYAIDEAMKATFNDSNAFSDAITSVRFKDPNTAWKKAFNVAGEGLLPFRRTPANIVVRFAEYSPAGIAKGMWDMATHVRNGDMSAATAIDQITAGLTGTGVMMLGYMMAAGMNGIKLTGSGADEDEKRQGHQDYALEFSIGGQEYSYKIDWAAPANMPLFVGANIYNAMQNAGADSGVSAFTSIVRGLGTAFEPMLALSCMSSLNDLVEGVRYAGEGEALYTIATDIATGYFTQGIPALLRQGHQAAHEYKQSTFANSDDPTIRDIQKTAANIPVVGAAFQTDKVNAWGEKEHQGNAAIRAFNAFINPGTGKKIDNSALEQEITRLNEAIPESVTPDTADKVISYTDENGETQKNVRLTEEQYQTFAQTQGQTARDILEDVIDTNAYNAMTDEQKANVFRTVYSYAREAGRAAALPDYDGMEDWVKDLTPENAVDTIIQKAVDSSITGASSDITDDWKRGNDTAQSVEALDQAYKNYQALGPIGRKDFYKDASGRVKYFIDAKNAGMKTGTFADMYKKYQDIDGKDLSGAQKAQEWSNAMEKAVDNGLMTEKQKDILKKNMVFRYSGVYETLKYDEMIERNVPTDVADEFVRTVEDLKSKSGNGKLSNRETYSAIAGFNASESVKDEIMLTYMDDYDPTAKSPDTTELKYQYARQEMGLSAEVFAEAYGINNDGGTWRSRAEKMNRDTGISIDAAYDLIEIFEGKQKSMLINWYNQK